MLENAATRIQLNGSAQCHTQMLYCQCQEQRHLNTQTGQKEAQMKTVQEEFRWVVWGSQGLSVTESNDHSSIIKKPGKTEVNIRKLDLANFGTKAEIQTDLKHYAERRPKIPTVKCTEEFINRHAKDAKRKTKGDMKIKHRRVNDDTNCVSSIHSNMSRALRVRTPTKPKKITLPAPPKPSSETTIGFALPMALSQTSIVIAEKPGWPKRKAAMRATTTEPSEKRRRSSPSLTESDESMASTQTCPPILSANSEPSRQKRRQMLKEQQIKNKFIISTIKNTAARNQDTEQSNFQVGPCSTKQPYPTQ